jgi:hypothetical protein
VHPGTVTLTNGRKVESARVESVDELPDALVALGLSPPRPTVVLVGGAGELSKGDLALMRPIFSDVLVPTVERLGACVVDGGTAAGVMQLLGQARAEAGAHFPLLGVAAVGTVAIPGAASDGKAELEGNHTHFLFVPGSSWGDETPWLAGAAGAVSGPHRSVTVLLDGGEIAWRDVEESVRAGRRVLVVAGSGRTANVLGAALRGEATGERAQRLVASGLLTAVDPASLAASLHSVLAPPQPATAPPPGSGPLTLVELVDMLDDLTPQQKQLLKASWIDQLEWMGRAAVRAQRRYYRLRIVMVIGAVVVPALVGLNVRGGIANALLWVTFALGLVLGSATAIDQFFDFGERWRHYRRTSERLKAEGWLFLELAGDYEGAPNHCAVFARFARRVEDLLREDVDSFIAQVAAPRQQQRTSG